MTQPLLVLLAVAWMTALVYVLGRTFGRMRVQKELRCPVKETQYEAVLECRLSEGWGRGEPTDVVACAAFGGGAVTCKKDCIHVPLEEVRAKAHAHAG